MIENEKFEHYVLIGLLIIFGYLTFLLIKPFITYLLSGLIFVLITYPVYERINKKRIRNKKIASAIMILLLLLLIIIPSAFLITGLVNQSLSAIKSIEKINIQEYTSETDSTIVNEAGNFINNTIKRVADGLTKYLMNSIPNIIGSIAEIILGLFIMFFFMFFTYIDGKEWLRLLKKYFPMKEKQKDEFFKMINEVTKGVLYGQTLTAIIQGTLGGIMLWIFGVQNFLFWGFMMIIFSFFPFIGTPIIWVPIAIYKLYQGDYYSGIGILLFGSVILVNIDNIIKPKLIGDKVRIHPAVILIGVLGGLKLWGFIGLILGPLVISSLIILLTFDYPGLSKEFKKELRRRTKKEKKGENNSKKEENKK